MATIITAAHTTIITTGMTVTGVDPITGLTMEAIGATGVIELSSGRDAPLVVEHKFLGVQQRPEEVFENGLGVFRFGGNGFHDGF